MIKINNACFRKVYLKPGLQLIKASVTNEGLTVNSVTKILVRCEPLIEDNLPRDLQGKYPRTWTIILRWVCVVFLLSYFK